MLTHIGLVALGLVAGLLSGFAGVGGAIIIIPALVFFFGYDQLKAQGTSLGVLCLPVVALGFWQYWKNPALKIELGAIAAIAVGLFAGGYFGAKLANHLDPNLVRKAFSVFLLCAAVYLFVKK
jgi:uncharacterized membrane protein YfcA